MGGGFMLSFTAAARQDIATKHFVEESAALGDFVKILPNGEILFQFVKHEMGQGVSTAMAQIFVEELCGDWEKVKIDFPPADMVRYQMTGMGDMIRAEVVPSFTSGTCCEKQGPRRNKC